MAIARKPAAAGPRTKNVDRTFGPWRGDDGQLKMGISDLKLERADDRDWLAVGRKKYELTPGFTALLNQIHPINYTEADLEEYTDLIDQTQTSTQQGPESVANPHNTWKYKNLLKYMCLDMSDDSDSSTVVSNSGFGSVAGEPLFSPKRKIRFRREKGRKSPNNSGRGVVYLPGDINGLAKKLQ